MALTARFLADFSAFYSAVDKATSQLGGLQQEADAAGASVEKIGGAAPANLNKLAEASGKVSGSFDIGLGSIAAWAGGLVTVTAAIDLAKAGFSALVGFLTDSVKAAAEAEASQAKLHAALAAAGVAVPSVISAYQGYIDALKLTTIHSGDALEASAALLTTVGNVMPREMEAALQATTNLAQAFEGDLARASNAVAQAARGQTAQLEKAGITLDDTKVKAEGFSYIVDEVNKQMGGAAAAAADTYSGRLAQVGNAWGDLQESIGGAIVQNQTVVDVIEAVGKALNGTTGEFSNNQTVMNLVSDAVILSVRGFGLLIGALGQVMGPIRSTINEFKFLIGVLLKFNEMTAKIAGRLAPFSDSMADLEYQTTKDRIALEGWLKTLNAAADTTKVVEVAAAEMAAEITRVANNLEVGRGKTKEFAAATDQSAEALRLATENARAAAAALKAKEEAEKAAGKATEDAAKKATKALEEHTDRLVKLEGGAQGAVTEVGKLPPALEDTTAALELTRPAIGRAVSAVEAMPPAFNKAWLGLKGFGASVSSYLADDFGTSVVNALEGGGNVAQAALAGLGNSIVGKDSKFAKSITDGIQGVFGSSGMMGQIGKSLGSFVPMIGPMLAPAIDAVGQLFGKVFGKSEESAKVSPLRDEFFKLAGGLETLNPRVEQLTGNLQMVQAVFDAKTVEEYNTAIGNLNGLFQQEQDALATLTETASRYGLTLEELGPAFARQELDKKAQALYKDYEVLIAAGVKNSTVTKKMADEVNKYVKQAVKMGVEVPSAMRPMLENMAKMGVLTDSSGKKVKDLEKSGIKFSMSMSDGFKGVIASVDSLTNVLARSLGVELERTKDRVEGIPDTIDIKVKYQDKGFTPKGAKSSSVPGYQGGTAGFENFGAGTLVMLHGREAVVPESAVKRAGTSGAGSIGGTTVIVNAQGSFFDTPGDLQRLASKVNEALTARHGFTNRSKAA